MVVVVLCGSRHMSRLKSAALRKVICMPRDIRLLGPNESRLRNDLYCVEWGVKLYSNQPNESVPSSICSVPDSMLIRSAVFAPLLRHHHHHHHRYF